jgi:hypothetical protein
MIWALLFALGVPLWLIALGLGSFVLRARRLKSREGNVRCRLRRAGTKRWLPGHAIWVHDVLIFDGSPAVWIEATCWAKGVVLREASGPDAVSLKRLGPGALIASIDAHSTGTIELGARSSDRAALLGPFDASTAARLPGR